MTCWFSAKQLLTNGYQSKQNSEKFLLKLKRFYEKNMQILVTVSRAKDLTRDVTQQQQHKEKVWGC